MKKWKRLLLIGLSACMLAVPVADVSAAVDLNAKYDISSNQIPGWPTGPEITSDTGVLWMQTVESFYIIRVVMNSVIRQVSQKS